MKRKKVIITEKIQDLYLDGIELSDAIQLLKDLYYDHNTIYHNLRIVIQSEYDADSIRLLGDRLQTNEEYQRQLAEEQLFKKKQDELTNVHIRKLIKEAQKYGLTFIDKDAK